jgi:serine/threonine protein kinase
MEIQRLTNVYFVGPQAKKIQASTDEIQQNFGYDDEKGDYHVRIKDHLNYRYEIMETLGKGSFGQVLKCRDHKTINSDPENSIVAIKIIRNKKKFLTQAQTEVKILEQLVKWVSTHYIIILIRANMNDRILKTSIIMLEC